MIKSAGDNMRHVERGKVQKDGALIRWMSEKEEGNERGFKEI
jgi:hypothetical protein